MFQYPRLRNILQIYMPMQFFFSEIPINAPTNTKSGKKKTQNKT